MATFRARQRASQRRDVTQPRRPFGANREAPATDGSASADPAGTPPAKRPRPADGQPRPQGKKPFPSARQPEGRAEPGKKPYGDRPPRDDRRGPKPFAKRDDTKGEERQPFNRRPDNTAENGRAPYSRDRAPQDRREPKPFLSRRPDEAGQNDRAPQERREPKPFMSRRSDEAGQSDRAPSYSRDRAPQERREPKPFLSRRPDEAGQADSAPQERREPKPFISRRSEDAAEPRSYSRDRSPQDRRDSKPSARRHDAGDDQALSYSRRNSPPRKDDAPQEHRPAFLDRTPEDMPAKPKKPLISRRSDAPAAPREEAPPPAKPESRERAPRAAASALGFFAPCPRGLEAVLGKELEQLGAEDIVAADGGIGFSGDLDLMMRANLHSRTASRILVKMASGPYENEREINALAMQVNWPAWFSVERTIKVKTDAIGTRIKSLDYVSLTIKDAVCDRFRQAMQGRPSVDTRAPDIRIHAFLTRDTATIYLDTSGEALFKRGWRGETGEAPLRENLAAGILLLSGYDGSQALLDPMCGSGTFLVEAADIALNRAPGRLRRFAFEKFLSADLPRWEELKKQAIANELPATTLNIHGSDISSRMISIASQTLSDTGLSGVVDLRCADLFEVMPPAAEGLIVTNPPYGVRLDEQDSLAELYPRLGDWLKQHYAGWTAQFFTGDLRLAKLIRLTTQRRVPLYNGSLDCRLFEIGVTAGSLRKDSDE